MSILDSVMDHCFPTRRGGAMLLALTLALMTSGCMSGGIRSRVEITSDPPGAEVIWRGQPYGATPVTIPFIWYWHYDIALEKPGYKRLEVSEYLRTPPWFMMPFDLFAEIIPVPIHDTRYRHYQLEPSTGAEPAPVVHEINPMTVPIKH